MQVLPYKAPMIRYAAALLLAEILDNASQNSSMNSMNLINRLLDNLEVAYQPLKDLIRVIFGSADTAAFAVLREASTLDHLKSLGVDFMPAYNGLDPRLHTFGKMYENELVMAMAEHGPAAPGGSTMQ